MKENAHVRQAARSANVTIWRIAREIGVCETTLNRWLRVPLTEEKEQAIMEAIRKLEQEAS